MQVLFVYLLVVGAEEYKGLIFLPALSLDQVKNHSLYSLSRDPSV